MRSSLPGGGEAVGGYAARALLPILATAAVLAILPSVWFGDSPFTTSLAVQAVVFASFGVGFNLIFGCTNQLFLCVALWPESVGTELPSSRTGRRCPWW